MNRRNFLKGGFYSGCALTYCSNIAASINNLALYTSKHDDYKALVCIMLDGGHDSFNLLVPNSNSAYSEYQKTRQNLAIPRPDLVSLNQSNFGEYGIPNYARDIAQLFNDQALSIVANVGVLKAPATKKDLINNSSLRPSLLFAHDAQMKQALTLDNNLIGRTSGWGARLIEAVESQSSILPSTYSFAGKTKFLQGQTSNGYTLSTNINAEYNGLNPDKAWDSARVSVHESMLGSSDGNLMKQMFNQENLSVREKSHLLNRAIESAGTSEIKYPSNNPLAQQLKQIAKLMSTHQITGQNRQVYFASLKGFDTHDHQSTTLPILLKQLAEALKLFKADLINRKLFNNVTTFTQSEFGRTLTSNGDGTDHGWAGHQLVMGGSIRGGNIIGDLPPQVLNTEHDFADGRMIPTTSLEQLASELTSWFGLSTSENKELFPNLYRFDKASLGLIKTQAD